MSRAKSVVYQDTSHHDEGVVRNFNRKIRTEYDIPEIVDHATYNSRAGMKGLKVTMTGSVETVLLVGSTAFNCSIMTHI